MPVSTPTPTDTTPNPAGIGVASFAVVLLGLGAVIAKGADLPGPILAVHRLWVAALIYLAILYARRGRFSLAALRGSMWGGLTFGLNIWMFFAAVQLTTVANATMIIALQPILVMLIGARFFGEPLRWADGLLMVVAVAGVGLVVLGSSETAAWNPRGDLLAGGALLMWALYFAASKQARVTLPALDYQAHLVIAAVVVVLPGALIADEALVPSLDRWWWILAMVLVPGTGHLLVNWAHAHVPLGLVSLLTLVSPVVGAGVAAIVFEEEKILPLQVAGMVVVLGALAVIVRRGHEDERRRRPPADEVADAA
ncbi:MAG: DMT family transporter [Actinomycetota bacterium]|nr:DMT family transporter [Actinomycetota bacterium]